MSATDVLDDQSSLVYSLIYQASPDPVTKEELTEQSGLETDELRSALSDLEKRGMVAGDAEGYRRTNDELAGEHPLPDAEPPEDGGEPASDGEQPTIEMSLAPAGPAAGKQIRVSLGLLASYGAARGESDEAATKKAQAIATEVGNALAAAMPNVAFHVDVLRVEAFDEPRRVWPPEDDES